MSELKNEQDTVNPENTEGETTAGSGGKKVEKKADLAEKNKALEAELAKLKAEMAEKANSGSAKTGIKNADDAKTMAEDDPRRLVDLRLPKNKYQAAPMYVAVGDYNALIPRGVKVQVPFYVAKHIQECLDQEEKTVSMLTQMQNSFAADTDRVFGR